MIDWEKQFPIAWINRADLTEFGFTDEQISSFFTDEVMAQIAATMQEGYYLHYPFWDDFRRAISAFIEVPHERKQDDRYQTA